MKDHIKNVNWELKTILKMKILGLKKYRYKIKNSERVEWKILHS